MRFLKVGGAALNQTPLDWKGNRERILEAIRLARRERVSVLCLPELCISGYGCEDAFHGESVAELSWESLGLITPESRGMVVALGLPIIHNRRLYNTAALLVDGKLAGLAAKKVLAGHGVYYEPRWFHPWPGGLAETQQVDGQRVDGQRVDGQPVPIGDLVFNLDGIQLGFEICEDAWGRGQAGFAARQADILLNPSASHFAFEKYETLKDIVREGSRVSHAVYLFSNLLGNEAGRLIFDGSALVASNGVLMAENRRFSYREVNLTSAIVDLRANRLERRRLVYPAQAGKEPVLVEVDFHLEEPDEQAVKAFRAIPAPSPSQEQGGHAPPSGKMTKNEEFAKAVSLGLWDYLRKSRSLGFAVSLSGGVDSASVAVLCWMMAGLALEELGGEKFREMLPHITDLPIPKVPQKEKSFHPLVKKLLTTVYQSTANSSTETRQAAGGLAEQINARHLVLDVEPIVEAYRNLAGQALGRKLNWDNDDIALQNIQARVRSPGIWLVANLEGLILLSTSNRSEVGVGYTTMDGDTSGGLAPIAGANKTFLRSWLRWMETDGLTGLGPLSALGAVNIQAPTAELRPSEAGQKDEDDLMPYPVLDAIEQAAIRDRMTPLEVWRTLLVTSLPGITLSEQKTAEYVTKFFQLWSQSQWKRERLAPSFHLDDENLDPRTWCRFPILSSGYEMELETLRLAVEAL